MTQNQENQGNQGNKGGSTQEAGRSLGGSQQPGKQDIGQGQGSKGGQMGDHGREDDKDRKNEDSMKGDQAGRAGTGSNLGVQQGGQPRTDR